MGRCCGQSMSIVVSLEYRIQGSPGYCCTIPVLFQFRFVSTIRPARRIFVRNRKGGHVSVSVSTPDKHWPYSALFFNKRRSRLEIGVITQRFTKGKLPFVAPGLSTKANGAF
jgi:hypothetical protein